MDYEDEITFQESIEERFLEEGLSIATNEWVRGDRANAIWFCSSTPIVEVSNKKYTIEVYVEPENNEELSGGYTDEDGVEYDFGPHKEIPAEYFHSWLNHDGEYSDADFEMAQRTDRIYLDESPYFIGYIKNDEDDRIKLKDFVSDSLYLLLDISDLKDIFEKADEMFENLRVRRNT